MSWWDRNDQREVDVVTGCFMLVRQKAIDAVGIMDEQFFMYGEETDFCYRFKQSGWKILFIPDAQIVHYGGQSSKSIRGEMLVQLRSSILHFMEKHYSSLEYRMSCLLVALFFLIRLPVWLVLSLLSKTRRSEATYRAKSYVAGTRTALAKLFTF